MEETTVRTQEGFSLTVATGTRDGILGTLGIGNTTGVDAVCCPECGLLRLYTDLE